jgi:capsid protein
MPDMGRLKRAWHALTGNSMSPSRMRNMVNAVYYAAASESSTMDFSLAADVGINRALFADLNKLRSRCRYELKQNGIAKGMPRVYANSVVGTGPKLSVQSKSNPEWARVAENSFAKWARQCDASYPHGGSLGMQLHLGVRQMFPTGEYFKVLRSFGDGPIKLRHLLIRPDRVKTPSILPDEFSKVKIDSGVEVDNDGIPAAYWFLKDDPDNTSIAVMSFDEFIRVEAKNVHHVLYRDDPIQHRGEPWMSATLATWHKLRRYDEATIAAAIVAAKFAAVLVNTNPDVAVTEDDILPEAVINIQDGMMMIPPPGYEPKQIQPQHPSTNAADFRRDQIGAAGAANAIPVNIATQDSSRNSFAGGRFDGVTLEQDGEVLRQLIADLDLNPTWAEWKQEAIAAAVIGPEPDDVVIDWLWPLEERHTDPSKAANASKTMIENGIETIGSIQMQRGVDRGQARESLLEEVEWFRANDLQHPLDAKKQEVKGNEQNQPAQDDDQPDNADSRSEPAE